MKRLPATIWVRWDDHDELMAEEDQCLLTDVDEANLVSDSDEPVTIGKYTFCEAQSVRSTTALERKPAPKGELPLSKPKRKRSRES